MSEGGGNDPENLIALCPTCHALYHRGTIPADAIYAYKSMLVALSRAFDLEAVDMLLFLLTFKEDFVVVTGDGLVRFSRLIAAGLATAELKANNNWLIVSYAINITEKGRHIIEAWRSGDRLRLKQTLGGPVPGLHASSSQRSQVEVSNMRTI